MQENLSHENPSRRRRPNCEFWSHSARCVSVMQWCAAGFSLLLWSPSGCAWAAAAFARGAKCIPTVHQGFEKASCFFILWIASHSHSAVSAKKTRALWLHEWKPNACDASKWSCWLCTTWLQHRYAPFHYAAFSNWRALCYCRKGYCIISSAPHNYAHMGARLVNGEHRSMRPTYLNYTESTEY